MLEKRGGVADMKKVKRLTYEDRQIIEKMMRQGARVILIADSLNVHRATIYKELKRGGRPYRADVAQRSVGQNLIKMNQQEGGEV